MSSDDASVFSNPLGADEEEKVGAREDVHAEADGGSPSEDELHAALPWSRRVLRNCARRGCGVTPASSKGWAAWVLMSTIGCGLVRGPLGAEGVIGLVSHR